MSSVTASPPISALEPYDPALIRSFDSDIVLPYVIDEVKISPNEYLFSENLNYAITKLSEIFDYLRNQTTMYDSVLPVYADYWVGNTLSAADLKALGSNGDTIWYIDNGSVVGTDLDLTELVRLSASDVGEFEQPVSLAVNSNDTLYVLDSFLVHLYNISDPTEPDYLAYFGGLGGAAVPTKFQSPREIHIDSSDNILVSDFGNGVVKVYNVNFGHLVTLEREAYSIASDDTHYYFLCVDGFVYKHLRTDYSLVSSFSVGSMTVIRHDNTQPGYLYLLSPERVQKWTVDGFVVGTFSQPSEPDGNLTDLIKPDNDENYVYISDQQNIYKYLDFQRTLTIVDGSVSAIHPLDSILVADDELPVPSIVYNNVLSKLEDNINTLSESITGCFVNTIGANDDELLTTSIISITPSANWCSVPKIPVNYIPSVNTFNEGFAAIYDCSQTFIDVVLNGKFDRGVNNIDEDQFCWSLAALRCSGPQYKNTLTNPITFEELIYTPSLSCSPMTSVCCENNYPLFTTTIEHVSGDLFSFEMVRVSGSELFEDDELLYVMWSEEACEYTNSMIFDTTFSGDGLHTIYFVAQDPGYLVTMGESSIFISGSDVLLDGDMIMDEDGVFIMDEDLGAFLLDS